MKTKLFFEHTVGSYAEGKDIVVRAFLDTAGQSINAVEGTLSIDPLFTITDIKSADSNVTFWVTSPEVAGNQVSFSGIVTGGINSQQVKILSLTMRPASEGSGTITARGVRVLQNDGVGTVLENSVVPQVIRIESKSDEQQLPPVDNEKPESFVPLVGKDPSMFDGQHFVAFYTQDKGTGIKEYKVKEGLFGSYTTAQSPYKLKNQRLDSTIYVKAIDMRGNERVETVSAENPSLMHIAIIVIVVLLGAYLWKRTFSKR